MNDPEARAHRRARRVAWAVRLGVWLVRLLAVTWRVRQVGPTDWRTRRDAHQPYVFAVWHGDLLSAVWAHRGEGIAMLVSEHSDGEIIARIGARFGQRAVRGSSSRGAARALLALVRTLQEGHVVAITPDGPRGPRHVAQAGVVAASQKSGAPVVTIGVAYSGAWTLGSWDRFRIPYPFARIVLAYSVAWVPAGTTDEGLDTFRTVMDATCARAAEALRA